ncbi:MAG: hypothetical protein KAT18_05580 [Candidatus Latescibacteria bacterium]|nr:hypothetical protein [Candidatus Latescibacterota bacterium]
MNKRTDEEGRPIRAVAMMSGGLDSTLAAVHIARMGIEVHGVRFSTGFSPVAGLLKAGKDRPPPLAEGGESDPRALKVGTGVEISFRLIDISTDFIRDVLTSPRYGLGQEMNPCIDCHIFMLRRTRPVMEEVGAHFVFTGEVLSQRPMSQNKQALNIVEEQSGLKGLLLRPLSARHLDPTIPEERGWVDRNELLNIRGRSRKTQIELADRYGISDYPQPAGGCLLTDPVFSKRLKELIDHTADEEKLTPEDMNLLKVGRHFRLPSGIKVVVGRNDAENRYLEGLNLERWSLQVMDHGSPITLVDTSADDDDLNTAAALTARYSQGWEEKEVRVILIRKETEREISVEPLQPGEANSWMI